MVGFQYVTITQSQLRVPGPPSPEVVAAALFAHYALSDLFFQDSSPLNPLIGVSDTANTEAFAGLQPHTEFRPYVSPFSLYPSLYSLASTHFSRPSSASSYSLSSAVINEVKRLDYGLLRQSHISSLSDPDLRCCRFEFSGDGTCSDPDCKDLHHRDVEPSDEEVANFAAPSFPEFPSEQLKNALMLTSSSAVMSSETSATSADPVQRRLMVAVRLLLVHKGIS
ncbi:uncharacterized protein EI90DRAFT_2101363 [Cantharellus anzutake]|uniref:uncharacterized protein n=1 Tax=Cantharellus anzutake TaxID=1750568 RepID=UPI001902D868|nr:uncharacterized protein EI90DRAFT_2101363 [Cantharellus anzutake]KAF8340700.1 hypothetical protein EI90DRAFT_2101363 [Cantharellus anzutake]